MGIEQVVNVSISRETATIDQAGFGRALILGPNLPGSDLVKLYSDLAAVAEDFATTDPEYIAASKLFGQALKPVDVLIGKRDTAVAQVETVTVNTINGSAYTTTLNGTVYSHTPTPAAQVDRINGSTDGSAATVHVIINTTDIPWSISSSPNMSEEFEELLDAINASSEPVTASWVDSEDHSLGILITADVAGTAFTSDMTGESGTLALANVTPNGPTKSAIVTALCDMINAGTHPVTADLAGSAPNQTMTLTADNAGQPFTLAVSSQMSVAHTTANVGVNTALDAIVASGYLGDSWYALILCSRLDYEILTAAAWIEARRKIFIACSSAAAILTSATTDIASQLQAAAYARTALLYSGDQAHYPEAAWLGNGLTAEPGSMTYSLKTLAGITYDELTATEIAYAKAKGANYYVRIGGVNITQNGNMAEGEWIDVIVGIDWILARASENIFATLVANSKIPFTDSGIDQVVNPLRQILQQAKERNILESFTIATPAASSFTAAQKQTRTLSGISFDGVLAGAVHAVTVTGKVHV